MLLGGMFTDLLPAIILLLSITIIGWVVILRLRRGLKNSAKPTMVFSLRDLEKMRSDGKLSEEEYRRAKRLIIDQAMKTTTDSQKDRSNGSRM